MMTIDDFRELEQAEKFAAFQSIPNKHPDWFQSRFFSGLTRNEQYFINSEYEKALQPAVDAFYKSEFGCIADRSEAGVEFDLKLKTPKGSVFKVEEKYRTSDFNDLLIELFQDVGYPLQTRHLGWFYNERAHRLVYVVGGGWSSTKPKKIYCVNMIDLRKNLNSLLRQGINHQMITSNRGRGFTINISIPWKDLTMVEIDGRKLVTEFIL